MVNAGLVAPGEIFDDVETGDVLRVYVAIMAAAQAVPEKV
jgi:hypothetical protein